MPAEADYVNADAIHAELAAALVAATTVIVDFTGTRFCDSAGIREIIIARRLARASNVQLRLAVPPGPLTPVFSITSLDQVVPIYPTLAAALTA
jgi:anti-sigma B factor antagonist